MPNNGGPSHASNFTAANGGVNYADKYSSKIDQRFYLESVVAQATNNDYDFTGVNTVNVYSVVLSDPVTYQNHGANRFGTPKEAANNVQALTIAQDEGFSITVDARSNLSTAGAMNSGAILEMEIREKLVPRFDKYVLGKLFDSALSGNKVSASLTASNAYDQFLDGQEKLSEAFVPVAGRVAFVTYGFLKLLKAGDFVLASDKGQTIHGSGVIGTVDGTEIIPVPSSYMKNANVRAIIIPSHSVVAPRRIVHYKTHKDPPGINGWLIEGRWVYDAFVLNNKQSAIFALSQTSG